MGFLDALTLAFAAVAAVAALVTIVQARAGSRERRLAEVADAVAEIDVIGPHEYGFDKPRSKLRATLIPVADGVPICRFLARCEGPRIRLWANVDTPAHVDAVNYAHELLRCLTSAAQLEIQRVLALPRYRLPFAHRAEAPPAIADDALDAARDYLRATRTRREEVYKSLHGPNPVAGEEQIPLEREYADLEALIAGPMVEIASRRLFDAVYLRPAPPARSTPAN